MPRPEASRNVADTAGAAFKLGATQAANRGVLSPLATLVSLGRLEMPFHNPMANTRGLLALVALDRPRDLPTSPAAQLRWNVGLLALRCPRDQL